MESTSPPAAEPDFCFTKVSTAARTSRAAFARRAAEKKASSLSKVATVCAVAAPVLAGGSEPESTPESARATTLTLAQLSMPSRLGVLSRPTMTTRRVSPGTLATATMKPRPLMARFQGEAVPMSPRGASRADVDAEETKLWSRAAVEFQELVPVFSSSSSSASSRSIASTHCSRKR